MKINIELAEGVTAELWAKFCREFSAQDYPGRLTLDVLRSMGLASPATSSLFRMLFSMGHISPCGVVNPSLVNLVGETVADEAAELPFKPDENLPARTVDGKHEALLYDGYVELPERLTADDWFGFILTLDEEANQTARLTPNKLHNGYGITRRKPRDGSMSKAEILLKFLSEQQCTVGGRPTDRFCLHVGNVLKI